MKIGRNETKKPKKYAAEANEVESRCESTISNIQCLCTIAWALVSIN